MEGRLTVVDEEEEGGNQAWGAEGATPGEACHGEGWGEEGEEGEGEGGSVGRGKVLA